MIICLERGADCLHKYGPAASMLPLHPKTSPSLASFKSRLVVPFWYWLTQVVLEKRALNRCSSSSSSFLLLKNTHGAVFDNNAVRQCGNTL